jgi:MFS family permease
LEKCVRVHLGLPQQLVPIFWALVFLEACYGSYMTVWPLWIERLGAPITVVGLVLGSTGIVRLFVLVPSSAIADRFGVRRTVVVARGVTVLALLSTAAATHWTHLAPMVIGTSIGTLAHPLLQSIVASQAGTQQMRSFALVVSVGPSIALIISPLISGAVVALWGMRAAFVLAAIFTMIAIGFISRVAEPEPHARNETRQDAGYRATLGTPIIRIIVILLLITVFSLSLGTSFIPNFLEDVRGMDAAVITTMSAIAAVGSAIFGLAVARLRRLQRVPFLTVALAVGLTAIGLLLFRVTGAIPLIVVAFLCRGGLFSAWAMLAAGIGEFATPAQRTRAFALCEMVGGFALAVGPIVAGPLYSYRATLPFDVALLLAMALIPLLVVVQRRAHGMRTTGQPSLMTGIAEAETGLTT